MIRFGLLFAVLAAICVYTWRDRFVALCALVLLSVMSQHPDMPTEMFGIPGLNPWNVGLLFIVLSWAVQPSNPLPPAPMFLKVIVAAYGVMLLLGGVVCLADFNTVTARLPMLMPAPWVRTVGEAVKDLFVNPAKYYLVGILLFLGCRSRRDAWIGIITLCLLGVAYSALTYKGLKLNLLFGGHNDVRRLTDKALGVHANDLAGLLTMCFWACIVVGAGQRGRFRWLAWSGAAFIFPVVIGCQSRAAYVANIAVALALAAARWRRLLLLLPVMGAATVFMFPQVVDRIHMGFDVAESSFDDEETDWNAVTAGRTHNIWDPVIQEIKQNPVFGYGRLAVGRTGCTPVILAREGFVPTHPHNSYLELLLDSGALGLTVVLLLLGTLGVMAYQLFMTRGDPLLQIVGGIGFVSIVNVMTLGLSSTFFYPKESCTWLLLSAALTTRVWAIHRARQLLGVSARPPAWTALGPPRDSPSPVYQPAYRA